MYQYTSFDRQFVKQRAAQYRDQLERNQARERAAQWDANVYVASMRANADVDVNPQLFE